jgi:hypothetical protein
VPGLKKEGSDMAAADSVIRSPKAQGTPLAETLLVIGVSAAGFAAVHAVEGAFGIAREILRGTSSGDGSTASGDRRTSSAAAGSTPGAHQAGGVVLIAGAAYLAMLLHRLYSDLRESLRDIRGAGPAKRTRRAAKTGESAASISSPWAERRPSGNGHKPAHRLARGRGKSGAEPAALPR